MYYKKTFPCIFSVDILILTFDSGNDDEMAREGEERSKDSVSVGGHKYKSIMHLACSRFKIDLPFKSKYTQNDISRFPASRASKKD